MSSAELKLQKRVAELEAQLAESESRPKKRQRNDDAEDELNSIKSTSSSSTSSTSSISSPRSLTPVSKAMRGSHSIQRRSVTVCVPATSANMGPGFDTVGMAVDMWNELTVTRATDGQLKIEIEGEGAGQIPTDETNLVAIGAKAAFEAAGEEYIPLHFKCKNRIPFGRGLGSSSAAIVSGIMAGLALVGHELKVYGENSLYKGGAEIEPEELLQIASDIEGHPDNVCPCIYGGIQLGILLEATAEKKRHWRSCRVNCPTDMQLVAFISDTVGKTSELRAVLPEKLTYAQAVFNIGRTAFLVNALNSNKLYDLKFGTQDALHQPQRGAKVYHHLQPLIDAGLEEGACAVYLSGAGPTVMAITSGAAGDVFAQRSTERTDIKVANAMVKVAKDKGYPGQVYITRPVQHGAYISKADPPFSTGLLKYPGGL